MKNHKDYNLSLHVTVKQYLKYIELNDRQSLSKFIIGRFNERYLNLICNSSEKHGFSIMAISCILIETLESFYEGVPDTKGKSGRMFSNFFIRNTPFSIFNSSNNWFYTDIRCGILHQGETKNGWRILRSGPLLSTSSKSINASKFSYNLKNEVTNYANKIPFDNLLFENFTKKMKSVCSNCE